MGSDLSAADSRRGAQPGSDGNDHHRHDARSAPRHQSREGGGRCTAGCQVSVGPGSRAATSAHESDLTPSCRPLGDPEERKDPELLARSPALRKRIADDSGKTQEEVLEP